MGTDEGRGAEKGVDTSLIQQSKRLLDEPTVVVAGLSAASYVIGALYINAFYGHFGLDPSSLDLATTDYLFAASIPLILLAANMALSRLGSDATMAVAFRRKERAASARPAVVFAVMVVLTLGLAYVALAIGTPLEVLVYAVAAAGCIGLSRGLAGRRMVGRFPILAIGLALASVAAGKVAARWREGSPRRAVLETTKDADWPLSGKPVVPVLHRGGVWYVFDTGTKRAHVVRDEKVLCAYYENP